MSASRATRLLAAATLVVVPPICALSPAPAQAAAKPSRACGAALLAVAAPYATVDGQARAGTVTLYRGTRKAATLSQGAGGLDDTPERGDAFGSALAAGDFDGDGCADLAVGASEEATGAPVPGGADGNGVVHLLRGTARGLEPAGTLDMSRLGRRAGTDRFGAALAAGDLDGDGDDELVVGAPGTREGGGVGVFGMNGRETAGRGTLITRATPWARHRHTPTDQFGAAVAAGDFDGDGRAEVAVGTPGDDVGDRSGAGSFTVVDPRARRATVFTQNSPGVSGEAEKWDGVGTALAAADFDHDGRADLAVGVPGEGLDSFQDGPMYGDGAVHVLYGTARGLSASGAQFWSGRARGIKLGTRNTDRLGSALAAGDLNGDGDAELAVGLPGRGAALVLPGTRAGGLTSVHHVVVKGRKGRPGDLSGSALAVTPSGLVTGSPGAARVTLTPSHVRKGSYTGLRPDASRVLSGPADALFGFAVTS
ncbi:FG-GAP-like repeat-containing protein [Sphaerisporangium sp. TRM90804]|uniref:FG-GAP-like repeat-containing protein n=1 Tax=Sphaerisporangium sp. TRM90804 TaxID=3031113 RepID=UPI002447E341|nr:FG-GAP-like repeat-containing protein [Sphaerisporangium sp. TRM90804]MDH2429602.1 FG-GAP-like repeat-containing protein [Sphaerisporangium sp. TRM90804]